MMSVPEIVTETQHNCLAEKKDRQDMPNESRELKYERKSRDRRTHAIL
jgi:hypothetical protein